MTPTEQKDRTGLLASKDGRSLFILSDSETFVPILNALWDYNFLYETKTLSEYIERQGTTGLNMRTVDAYGLKRLVEELKNW